VPAKSKITKKQKPKKAKARQKQSESVAKTRSKTAAEKKLSTKQQKKLLLLLLLCVFLLLYFFFLFCKQNVYDAQTRRRRRSGRGTSIIEGRNFEEIEICVVAEIRLFSPSPLVLLPVILFIFSFALCFPERLILYLCVCSRICVCVSVQKFAYNLFYITTTTPMWFPLLSRLFCLSPNFRFYLTKNWNYILWIFPKSCKQSKSFYRWAVNKWTPLSTEKNVDVMWFQYFNSFQKHW